MSVLMASTNYGVKRSYGREERDVKFHKRHRCTRAVTLQLVSARGEGREGGHRKTIPGSAGTPCELRKRR